MSVFAQPAAGVLARRVVAVAAGAFAAAVLSLLLTMAFGRTQTSFAVVLAGGVGLIAVTAVALARYEAAVWLGMVLLVVVKVEPAPTDAVLLVAIAVGIVTGRFVLRRVPGAVGALLGTFLALNIVAATESLDFFRTARFAFITFYLAILSVWLASWVDRTRRARLIVRGYVLGAVLSAVIGVGAAVGVFPGRTLLTYAGGTRAEALFKDPNVFGAFLVPAALFLIDEALRPRLLRARRSVLVLGFVICCVGVVFSFSRAAWANLVVGIVVMILVFGVRRGGARRALLLLAGAAAAAAATFAVLSATGSVGFLQERSHLQGYDTARFGAQERGLQLVQHHPIGVGPGQFELYTNLSAHETYVRALAETGVLGLAAIAGVLLTTLVLALRNVVLARETYGVGSAPLLAAWCGLLFSGFFIDTLHWRHLWVIAALIWAGAMQRPLRRAEL